MGVPRQGRRSQHILAIPLGKIAFGHTVANTNHWIGTIASFVMLDTLIRAKTFKCLAQTTGGIPNPWENDALETAFRQRLSPPPPIELL